MYEAIRLFLIRFLNPSVMLRLLLYSLNQTLAVKVHACLEIISTKFFLQVINHLKIKLQKNLF